MPKLSPRILLLFAALTLFIVFIQFGFIRIAFERLGLAPESAYLLLISTLVGSFVNLPVFTIDSDWQDAEEMPQAFRRLLLRVPSAFIPGKTIVSVNAGGCVIPVAFSAYLFLHHPLHFFDVAIAVALVSTIAYLTSRPVAGIGIAMPLLIAPVAAALVASLINPEQRAPLAYIAGTLGVLIGADLLRLGDIRALATPIVSIGGAGTFDGIFFTGFAAVLLA